MKAWLAVALAVCLCAGCGSGSTPKTSDGSGITMYGTIDQGVTFRK